MFLTEANVLHYLVERNFADLESVVSGDFAVRKLSYRNRNFRVTCGAREYLVKQARKWTALRRGSVDREASFYWQVRTEPRFEALRGLVPESYGYDPPHSILILKFLPEQTTLHHARDRFSLALARLVAAGMAALHRDLRSQEIAQQLPAFIPWYLSVHEEDPETQDDYSEGQRELVRLVRKHAAFGRALDSIRADRCAQCLVHGDWKPMNCLISAARDRLSMVDWEFAAWGDPRSDAGTMLQAYWNFWVRSPEQHPIAEIQPAMLAFLQTYSVVAGIPLPDLLIPVIRFAAARMLQSAHEALANAEGMNREAARLAQASLNILTRPEQAAAQLLGT
jgi:Ser/Thr protein kinase RdoA (MazF antagonist)